MPMEEDAVDKDFAVGQRVLQVQNNRPFKLGNQPAHTQRHFPQTPICKGGHLCHSIQLARLSSLISHHQPCRLLQSGIRSLFLGQLGPSFKSSCPRQCLFPFNLTPSSAFPFLAPLNHRPPSITPQLNVYTQEKAGGRGGGAAGSA